MLEKKLRFTLSATNALVVFYWQNFGEFFGKAEALEAIGVEAEAVCKYTAFTSLIGTQTLTIKNLCPT